MKTALPKRSEHAAEQLAAIGGVVQELLGDELAMLILFGSYARGDWVNDRYVEDGITYSYQSDFDLLVVSESRHHATVEGEARLSDAIGRRLRERGLDRPSSTILVEDIGHLNKALQRGNYFYGDIRKEGVLLFDNGRHSLAEPAPLDPVESQKDTRDDFEHWFKNACGFMKMYEAAREIEDNNIAAFQLHQATERFLSAIILTFTRYKPKTHDLEKLDRQASNLDAEFFTVFLRATEHQNRCFELLKSAYIDARYKRDFVITKEELDYLSARVRKLEELTQRICQRKIASMA